MVFDLHCILNSCLSSWECLKSPCVHLFMDAVIIKCVFSPTGCTTAINVICPSPRSVVILFQPVTLRCDFTTSDSNPLISWKYKSYCKDPIQAALNPSSADNAIAQSNPNYNPNIECADSARTVRIVGSKQTAVTFGPEYQGRQISIINSKLTLHCESIYLFIFIHSFFILSI